MKNCLSPERMLEIEKIISKQDFDNVEELLHNEYEINYYKVAFKLPKKFFDVMLEIEAMSLNKRDNIIIEYISNKFKISEDLVKIRLEQVYMMNNYINNLNNNKEITRIRTKKNNED